MVGLIAPWLYRSTIWLGRGLSGPSTASRASDNGNCSVSVAFVFAGKFAEQKYRSEVVLILTSSGIIALNLEVIDRRCPSVAAVRRTVRAANDRELFRYIYTECVARG